MLKTQNCFSSSLEFKVVEIKKLVFVKSQETTDVILLALWDLLGEDKDKIYFKTTKLFTIYNRLYLNNTILRLLSYSFTLW